jgi:hypothetical protein
MPCYIVSLVMLVLGFLVGNYYTLLGLKPPFDAYCCL